MSFTVPPLTYPFDALEPYIDEATMRLHHEKHHATYVNNLNKALESHPALAQRSLLNLLTALGDIPDSMRTTVRNNAGGHANHTLFWSILQNPANRKAKLPDDALREAINASFGSLERLQQNFNDAGAKLFGSGWVFLLADPEHAGQLRLETRANQDSPLMDGLVPVLGNDVWEHAYYLHYQNRRADYLSAWWNVVNWDVASARYAEAKAGNLVL